MDADGTVEASDQVLEESDDEDVCRICRFSGRPGDPLRHPCGCRGSIKYVHQECLLLWLNRRRTKKCEVCKRRYSFAPLYLENAPERLSLYEFTIGLGLRIVRFMKPMVRLFLGWFVVIPLVSYYAFRLFWGMKATDELQEGLMTIMPVPWIVSASFIAVFQSSIVANVMIFVTIVRTSTTWLNGVFPGFAGEIAIDNVQGPRVFQMIRRFLWILCDWWHQFFGPRAGLQRNAPPPPLHEFGAIRRFLFFLDDNAFAVLATNVSVWFLFGVLPFSIGRIFLTLLWLFPPTKHMVVKSASAVANSPPLSANITASSAFNEEIASEFSNNITKQIFGDLPDKQTIRADILSSERPIPVGYMIILSLAFAYLGSVIILHRALCRAIARWLSMGFLFFIVAIPYLSWIFLVTVWRNLALMTRLLITGVKVSLVLSIKFGVLPWIVGFWLAICTTPMFGGTVSQRFELLLDEKALIILYWVIGIFYMVLALSSMNLVQKIVRERAFWFILDVTDPDYKIYELHLCQNLLALAIHGILIVIVFHLPTKIISPICPSLFPLNLSSWNDKETLAAQFGYIYSFRVGPELLAELVHRARIEPLVRKWFIQISSWLQLDDFLLTGPQNQNLGPDMRRRGRGVRVNQNARPLLHQRRRYWELVVFAIAEGSMVSFYTREDAETSDENIDKQSNFKFLLKIMVFLVLAVLSLDLIISLFMALPILVGRVFFSYMASLMRAIGLQCNDVYTFWIGFHILQATQTSCSFVFDHIRTGKTILLLNRVLMWIRNLLLFSIWVCVVPGLLGLLIDLMIIIPLQVPLDETPVFFLLKDWLLGLVFLHTWIILVMLTENDLFSTRAWREKLRRINTIGVNRLSATWLLREFLGSIITTLLTILCVPYVLQRFITLTLGYSAIQRYIWPIFLASILVWFSVKLIRALIISLHHLIFTDRYGVGHTLCDFSEDLERQDRR